MSDRPVLELDLDKTGHGSVKLNGYELPFTTSVTVEANVTEPTKVTLTLVAAEVLVKAKGIRIDPYMVKALEEIVNAFNEESDLLTVRVGEGHTQ